MKFNTKAKTLFEEVYSDYFLSEFEVSSELYFYHSKTKIWVWVILELKRKLHLFKRMHSLKIKKKSFKTVSNSCWPVWDDWWQWSLPSQHYFFFNEKVPFVTWDPAPASDRLQSQASHKHSPNADDSWLLNYLHV